MSLFVHERPTLTLMDFSVQIVSESISNRVDYKMFLGDAPDLPRARAFNIRTRCPSSRLNVQPTKTIPTTTVEIGYCIGPIGAAFSCS